MESAGLLTRDSCDWGHKKIPHLLREGGVSGERIQLRLTPASQRHRHGHHHGVAGDGAEEGHGRRNQRRERNQKNQRKMRIVSAGFFLRVTILKNLAACEGCVRCLLIFTQQPALAASASSASSWRRRGGRQWTLLIQGRSS